MATGTATASITAGTAIPESLASSPITRQQPEPDERGATRPRDARAAVRGEAPEPVLDDEGARDADEEEQADARAAEARLPSAFEQAGDLVGAVVAYPLEEAGEVGALITRSREVDVAEREDGRGAGRAPCDDVADAHAVSREHHDRHPERGDHGEDAAHVAAEHRETLDQDAGHEDRDRDVQSAPARYALVGGDGQEQRGRREESEREVAQARRSGRRPPSSSRTAC